jgi:dihydroorotase
VTCEAAPHHFALSDEAVRSFDTNTKMSPPLRSSRHVEAVKAGLADGTIDAVATDHAPHTIQDKEVEFDYAANGIIGLETAFGLTVTSLVEGEVLSLGQAIARLTSDPARIFGLSKGTLSVGADADVAIVDPAREWVVDITKSASKSRNSPFHEWKLRGQVLATIVGGKIAWELQG